MWDLVNLNILQEEERGESWHKNKTKIPFFDRKIVTNAGLEAVELVQLKLDFNVSFVKGQL